MSIISIRQLSKVYGNGFQALKPIDLDIEQGEIFALLGPNGAGKTTLISIVCGIVNPSAGSVIVDGHDIVNDYRAARASIGLVPQELTTEAFESVWGTVNFSRGLFGKKRDDAFVEKTLRSLSLLDKKNAMIMSLSGGMKRRVLIAKALAHEPKILFLDEPTAGVDVDLRRDMWQLVRELKAEGVTIILTTHYIEEAEEMADRIGVINKGELIVVETKTQLMAQMGKKQLRLQFVDALTALPDALQHLDVHLDAGGRAATYTFDARVDDGSIAGLLKALADSGIAIKDIESSQSSLEDIFVDLVKEPREGGMPLDSCHLTHARRDS